MRGDTDLRFCTYTCTEFPRVPLCCHFATYNNFPEKKSVPELNDQPTYLRLVNQCNNIIITIYIVLSKCQDFSLRMHQNSQETDDDDDDDDNNNNNNNNNIFNCICTLVGILKI